MDLLDDFEENSSSDVSDNLENDYITSYNSIEAVVLGYREVVWGGQEPSELVQVGKHEDLIRTEMQRGDVESVGRLSQLVPLLSQELELQFECIHDTYKERFPGLRSIVPMPKKFVGVVKMLEETGPDLSQIRLDRILPKEEVLLVSMMLQSEYQNASINTDRLHSSMQWFDRLSRLLEDLQSYLEAEIESIAPNLCSLVGSSVTTKLISHCGSVKELSQIPSCNLASIGKPKHMHHRMNTDTSGVRQKGYIFESELVQSQPSSYQKQALRMLCGKISLAARTDCSVSCTDAGNGPLGAKWKQELLDKLEKIKDPPNIGNVKPLPIPEDKPKKKRAGRRFRKYKQQFQLSHLRQLQNRVEFGKEEQTTMDAFGDEIGFGMANTKNAMAFASTGNKSKLTKVMKKRLAQESIVTDAFLQDDRSGSLKQIHDSK